MTIKITKAKRAYAKLFITTKVRLSLYKKIATFLDDRVPVDQILSTLSSEFLKNKKTDPRAIMLLDWYNEIEDGRKLYEAMSSWAPPGEVMMIQAAELKGDLASGFRNALSSTEAASNMKSAIIGAVSYPGILFSILFLIIYVFSTQAIPKLAQIKDPAEWPDVSKSLYDLSKFVETKWWVVILGIMAFAYFCSWSTKNLTGPVRKILDYAPPWSVYKSFQSSVFLISLSAMMKSGTGLVESIEKLRKMSPKYISDHLKLMLNKFENGDKIGEALVGGFLDKETAIDIRIFGQTANVQDAMDSIGRTSIQNSIDKIKAVSSLLNIIAMGLVAAFIGWVYFSFFTLTQSVGQAPM